MRRFGAVVVVLAWSAAGGARTGGPADLGLSGCGCTGGPECCDLSFTYREGADSLRFTEPDVALFNSRGRTCESHLPTDKGNQWNVRDLHVAFSSTEVTDALKKHRAFRSQNGAGEVHTTIGDIVWKSSCSSCAEAPQAIEHLHAVLHGLLVARANLCSSKR